MRILITGATGFVGKSLTKRLLELGHEVNILSRNKENALQLFNSPSVKVYEWSDISKLPPQEAFQSIKGIINLMGENIAGKRWSATQKKNLRDSRVLATQNILKSLQDSGTHLDFLVSSSAIGIYPVNQSKTFSEDSKLGNNFLANLCKEWEAATGTQAKIARTVIVRTGVVLEKHDGALKKMLPPFKLGLGGPIGDGNQFMSWIHLDDLVNLFVEAATNSNYQGVYNGTAPAPINNFDFTKALGHALNRPTIFPVPTLPLKIAFGEMASVILDSQQVVSKRLEEVGFQFKYKTASEALNKIFNKA